MGFTKNAEKRGHNGPLQQQAHDVETMHGSSAATPQRLHSHEAEKSESHIIGAIATTPNSPPSSRESENIDIEKHAAEQSSSLSLHRTATHRSRIGKPLHALVQTLTTRSNASIIDPGPPPDGGIKAWTQACMGHLVILNTWGMVATFGVFQAYYTQELGLEPSAVSWIGSVQMLGHFGLGACAVHS